MFQAINNGRSDTALNYVCESFILPVLPERFLFDDDYELITETEGQATVRVTGEIRYVDSILSLKKELDFEVKLEMDREDKWCVTRDSFLNFLEALTDSN